MASAVTILTTELQSLASETRRKYPDVREAADKAIALLKAHSDQSGALLSRDGQESEDLVRPLFLGCATRNAKIVIMCLSSLHRLITLKAIATAAVPGVVATLSDCVSQGVDVQLRILQILLSLLTNYPSTHGDLLGDALLLCFKLQDSRIAVVSSTAAATLRQLVMLVFDKVVENDRRVSSEPPGTIPELTSPTTLPNGETVALRPSVKDAFSVFEDLCLLANSEQPRFLRLESLPKTFSLELIESVLTNYHDLFRQRKELLLLLQHHLCPSLLKSLSDKPVFPLTLRSIRVVFLLLKQFIVELETEAEIFLSLITKIISGDHEPGEPTRPPWMRVLAMEIMRGLCSEVSLVRAFWDRYDSKKAGYSVFASLVTALKRLAMEKPALLGVEPQMFGIGATSPPTADASSTYGIDVGAVSAMMMTGAANMVGMAGGGGGLSIATSSMKLQCIDQLDKADAPPIPDAYVYLLALQCITSLAGALAALTIPVYTSISMQRPRSAGDAVLLAPPALDVSTLSPSDPHTPQLKSAYGMIESAWPATLAALSFFISTNLSEDLFADVLTSIQNMTNASGALGLWTPRDAFLTCLSKFAIPAGVVSSLDSARAEPSTPHRGGVLSVESLGLSSLTGGASQPPSLSERNVACLKVLLSSALFLAGSLGSSWFNILEALQNAEYVLFTKAPAGPGRRASTGPGAFANKNRVPSGQLPTQGGQSGAGLNSSRPTVMQDLDPTTDVQALINRLFDASKKLDDDAFQTFTAALCRLSSEMVGMQAANRGMEMNSSQDDLNTAALLSPTLSPGSDMAHRRRASGIQLARAPPRSGDYAITKLGYVSRLNMHRLIYRDPSLAWDPVTGHLLSVIRTSLAPASIRLQAAEVLDSILVIAPRNINSSGESQAQVQLRVLEVLSQQVIFEVNSATGAVTTDIRKLGLETLHEILQISAHSFVVGWNIVFEMMSSVCQPARPTVLSPIAESPSSTSSKPRPPPLRPTTEKGNAVLARVAFKSLTLVCDSVETLPPDDLRLCIATIALFGQQSDTNMALTAAESLLWSVSDSIQSKRRDTEKEAVYSELWMFLLKELSKLCTDARPDVRNGAIQTLFRSLQLYGATLSAEMWTETLDEIVFPLLDSMSDSLSTSLKPDDSPDAPKPEIVKWDSSKHLTFQLFGSLLSAFLVLQIMPLPSFTQFWDKWAGHVVHAAIYDPRGVSASALTSLESTLSASREAGVNSPDVVLPVWERTWTAIDTIGVAIGDQQPSTPVASSAAPSTAFTQETLLAFTHTIKTLYSLHGSDWDLPRLQRLLQILKGVVTYSKSPEYRPDIDTLTPVQAAVCDTVQTLELTKVPGLPSLVLVDLADYAALAYYAGFTVLAPDPSTASKSENTSQAPKPAPKHVTYIALSKKTMPWVVELCGTFKSELTLYNDGTIEHVIAALSIPIKLRYDCPPASKYGSDLPLWKTATTSFLSIVEAAAASLPGFGTEIADERFEAFWRRTVEGIRGGLLSDCSPMDRMPFAEQDAEEQFDRNLLLAIESTVIPQVGDARVEDAVILQLGKSLELASRLHETDDSFPMPAVTIPEDLGPKRPNGKQKRESASTIEGTTAPVRTLPREQFSYWAFDLLLEICHDDAPEEGELSQRRRRIAALCLPSLLNRCHSVFTQYVVDEALRGNVPFQRIREEELLYCLRKLPELQLWPGCLWAAISDDPTGSSLSLPPLDPTLPPQKLIADATKRSTFAHLFYFYPLLYEIATVPRNSPSAWIVPTSPTARSVMSAAGVATPPASIIGNGRTPAPGTPTTEVASIEVDARQLAKACLRQIGKEIGAER